MVWCFFSCGASVGLNGLTIIFSIASLALEQSYDFPSASDLTVNIMDKIDGYPMPSKHNKNEQCA